MVARFGSATANIKAHDALVKPGSCNLTISYSHCAIAFVSFFLGIVATFLAPARRLSVHEPLASGPSQHLDRVSVKEVVGELLDELFGRLLARLGRQPLAYPLQQPYRCGYQCAFCEAPCNRGHRHHKCRRHRHQ